MAYQSLICGILFSIGIFAVKSGVGIYYVMSRQEKKRAKVLCFSLFALTYLVVFAAAVGVLIKIDLLRHLASIQSFIKSGMIVHLIMAALMMIWGVVLLKQGNRADFRSRGWLMLVVPCPVCVTVIFFSAGFLMTCFPDTPKTVAGLLYMGFVLINILTMGVIALQQHRRPASSESLLGVVMILIAVYFFMSVTVMPQFSDVDKIYRMARYQGEPVDKKVLHILFPAGMVVAAFWGGYVFRLKQIRSAT